MHRLHRPQYMKGVEMSDRPFKLYVIPIIGGSTHNNNGEYNDEDLYINAEKLRERLVGMKIDSATDIWEIECNATIDEILKMMDDMIDEQKEGE